MLIYTITGRHPDGTVDVVFRDGYKFYGKFHEADNYYEGRLLAPDGTVIFDGVSESYTQYIEEYEKLMSEKQAQTE